VDRIPDSIATTTSGTQIWLPVPPAALGGGVSAEAEMEFADHHVPTRITGGNVFRRNGGQALEAGLQAVQVSFGDRFFGCVRARPVSGLPARDSRTHLG
jgi:hypothetical protein